MAFFREALRRLVSKRQGGGSHPPPPCQDVLWKMPCQGEGYTTTCQYESKHEKVSLLNAPAIVGITIIQQKYKFAVTIGYLPVILVFVINYCAYLVHVLAYGFRPYDMILPDM